MKGLFLVPFLVAGFGCATSDAWMVERWQGGGVVGYKGDDDDPILKQKFIVVGRKICPESFKIVRESRRSENGTATIMMPVTNTSTTHSNVSASAYDSDGYSVRGNAMGTSTTYSTSQAPSTFSFKSVWIEAEIKCESWPE